MRKTNFCQFTSNTSTLQLLQTLQILHTWRIPNEYVKKRNAFEAIEGFELNFTLFANLLQMLQILFGGNSNDNP